LEVVTFRSAGRPAAQSSRLPAVARKEAFVATAKPKADTPFQAIGKLIPKLSHDELLEAILRLQEEGAKRCANYADAIYEAEEIPVEIVNEALVFIEDLEALVRILGDNSRESNVWRRIRCAKDDINRGRAKTRRKAVARKATSGA
jgi:hypothetical protein